MGSSRVDDNTVNTSRKDFLRRLLCALWLRPESALWYAHELFVAGQYLGTHFRQPSLEVGCMDGTNTFLILGGEFGLGFDVYTEVMWNRYSHEWKSLNDDYFNTFKADWAGELDIRVHPTEHFEVGLSWKQAHIVKAARLGIYKRLIEHDPNVPLTMFENQSFATVWAPNLYWIENLDGVIRELRRLLYADGRLITILPDSSQLDSLLYRFVDRTDPAWIRDLDRGRYSNASRQALNLSEWEHFFKTTGFRVSRHDRFLPKVVAQVYDIGLRPMFPVFMHIYETLRQHCPNDLLHIKEHWIETAFHFLAPLCETEWMERRDMEKVWHIFELQPTDG